MAEFLRRVPEWFRVTDNIAMDEELKPKVRFRLEEVRLHLDAVGGTGSGSFTITLSSAKGSEYDVVLISEDMAAVQDYVFRPGYDQRVLFDKEDVLKFEWANANGKVYGLEVIWSEVRD